MKDSKLRDSIKNIKYEFKDSGEGERVFLKKRKKKYKYIFKRWDFINCLPSAGIPWLNSADWADCKASLGLRRLLEVCVGLFISD